MAKPLVSDALWERIEPLLPTPKPRRLHFPGRRPLPPRQILTGIIFVLKTGIDWDDLPAELGCGCGRTCRKYLLEWQAAGVWDQVHALLLAELGEADKLDFARAAVEALKVRGLRTGTGLSPAARSQPGTRYCTLTEDQCDPTAMGMTRGIAPDVHGPIPRVDAVPPVADKLGQPQQRQDEAYGDGVFGRGPHRLADLGSGEVKPKPA